MGGNTKRYRRIPSVDRLLRDPAALHLLGRFPRRLVVEAVRHALAAIRQAAPAEVRCPENAQILQQVAENLAAECEMRLRPVVNASGVVLHTNLGRARLADEAVEAITAVAGFESNLEYDLTDGRRGDRDAHVEESLCALTMAEAATVVNNNAAAVLLVLNTLAEGREVVVSRGELVEIGGSFRIPDVVAKSGARLREVGTTNPHPPA